MKLKHARKSKSSISLTKNSIVMIVMLVVIVLATMAWFSLSRYSEALDVVVGTEDSSVIRFAMPESDGSYPTSESKYFNYLNFQEKMGEQKMDTFTQEVTGDGVNFVIPSFKSGVSPLEVDTESVGTEAYANDDYLSLTFYVRSTKKDIFIQNDSCIETGDNPLTGDIYNSTETTTVDNIENLSSSGNFSKNGIAGAIRVALIDVMDVDQAAKPTLDNLQYLWIPRPDLSLVENNDVFTLFKGVTEGDSYKHTYFSPNTGNTGLEFKETTDKLLLPKVSENPDDAPCFEENVPVTSTGKVVTLNKKTYYMYKFTVNMWLEGSDNESSNALNGGEFQLRMNFTA